MEAFYHPLPEETKFVVLSSANPKSGHLAKVEAICDTLEQANRHAKYILKMHGTYTIEYDEDGCLVMPDDPESGAPLPGNSSYMKIQVAKHTYFVPEKKEAKPKEVATQIARADSSDIDWVPRRLRPAFTKTVVLYNFTLVSWKVDKLGKTIDKRTDQDRYFLNKATALAHFHKLRSQNGHKDKEETVDKFCKHHLESDRLPEWDVVNQPRGKDYKKHCRMEITAKPFDVLFKHARLKKLVETDKSQFKVWDWDGSEEGYDEIFPSSPLSTLPNAVHVENGVARCAVELEAVTETNDEPGIALPVETPELLSKTLGGRVTKNKASKLGKEGTSS